jgi:hypothetical protein
VRELGLFSDQSPVLPGQKEQAFEKQRPPPASTIVSFAFPGVINGTFSATSTTDRRQTFTIPVSGADRTHFFLSFFLSEFLNHLRTVL